jgi:hypothetical protein
MRHAIFSAALAALFATGCAEQDRSNDLGTGLNTVSRDYMRTAPVAHEAAEEALKRSGMTIVNSRSDTLGGEIVARRAVESEIRVETRSLTETSCRITIRVEPGDAALANLLHERTANELGLGEATGGIFGGHVVTDCYGLTVPEARKTAQEALKKCDLQITSEDVHALWADIDARDGKSNPVRIHVEREDDGCTTTWFFAGTEKNNDNKALAERMKEAFEKEMK